MDTNEEIKQLHAALVRKVAEKCAVEGSAVTAIAIGNDVMQYGAKWMDGFSNDGKIDESEMKVICESFNGIVDNRIRNQHFASLGFVAILWRFVKSSIVRKFSLDLRDES